MVLNFIYVAYIMVILGNFVSKSEINKNVVSTLMTFNKDPTKENLETNIFGFSFDWPSTLKENSCVERNEKQINYLRSIIIRMLIICPEENPTEIVLSFFQKKNYSFLFRQQTEKKMQRVNVLPSHGF